MFKPNTDPVPGLHTRVAHDAGACSVQARCNALRQLPPASFVTCMEVYCRKRIQGFRQYQTSPTSCIQMTPGWRTIQEGLQVKYGQQRVLR